MSYYVVYLYTFIQRAINACLTLIYPPYCYGCRVFLSARSGLCQECVQRIVPIVSANMQLTKKYTMTVLAISQYKDPIRPLILAKIRSDIIAAQQLGQLMWQMTYIKGRRIDYIVPIPLHLTRYSSRGFNQSEEMAHQLSILSGFPVADILYRPKRTKFQFLLKSHERERNVSGAVQLKNIDYHTYQGKHFLLVDDLMTTGATLQVAAKELIKLRPASLTAVVASRVS